MYEYFGHCKTGNQLLEMANDPIGIYERNCLYFSFYGLSNIKLMVQEIIAYVILAAALTYLVHRFVFPIPFLAKKKSGKGCGPDCNC